MHHHSQSIVVLLFLIKSLLNVSSKALKWSDAEKKCVLIKCYCCNNCLCFGVLFVKMYEFDLHTNDFVRIIYKKIFISAVSNFKNTVFKLTEMQIVCRFRSFVEICWLVQQKQTTIKQILQNMTLITKLLNFICMTKPITRKWLH